MRTRLPMVFAVVALGLLVAIVAWGTSGIPLTPRPSDTDVTLPPLTSETVTMDNVPEGPPISLTGPLVIIVLLLVAVVLLVVIAGFRLRRLKLRYRRGVPAGSPGDPGWLSDVTRKAMSEMDRYEGGPPADAVIAAWVHLEESAAASGTEREAHQTPSEFTETVLAEHNADSVALQELKSVYQRARFGEPSEVTARDVTVARAALERIALEAK